MENHLIVLTGLPGAGKSTVARILTERHRLVIIPVLMTREFRRDEVPGKEKVPGRINNFIRAIYIYKHPIREEQIKKESGIPGGRFQKLSLQLLLNPDKEYAKLFQPFVLNEEIPYILKHLK